MHDFQPTNTTKKSSRIKWILFAFFLIIMTVLLIILFIFLDYGESDVSNLQFSTQKYNENKNVSDIIISFTTMPKRLQTSTFKKCVSNMLCQSMRPKEIRINIPYVLKKTGQKYEIPEWLSDLPVTINRCEDEGPATKYLSTLRDYADTKQKILVYDDDSILPLDSIKTYHNLTQKYPNTVISALGNRLDRYFDKNNQLTHTSHNPDKEGQVFYGKIHWIIPLLFLKPPAKQVLKEKQTEKIDIVYGMCGYCLSADMVDINVLADYKNMPKEAFFVDDIVISGHLASRGISRIVAYDLEFTRMTYGGAIEALLNSTIANRTQESLSASVNSTNKNNEVMIKYFQSAWGSECP